MWSLKSVPLVESPSPARDGPPVGPGSPGGSRAAQRQPRRDLPPQHDRSSRGGRPRGGRRAGALPRPPGRGRDQDPADPPLVSVLVEGTGHAAHLGGSRSHSRMSWTPRTGSRTGTYDLHGGQRRHADRRRDRAGRCRRGRPASSTSWRPRPSRAVRAASPTPPGASSSSATSTRSPARPSAPSTGRSPPRRTQPLRRERPVSPGREGDARRPIRAPGRSPPP